MKYEELSKEKKIELSTKFLMAQFQGALNCIKDKLGPTGLNEVNKYMAEECANLISKENIDSLKGYAYFCKACAESAFGSDIKLNEKEDSVELIHKRCGTLEKHKSDREFLCAWCGDFYRLTAEKLKLNFKSELIDKGCKFVVSK